MNDIQLYNYYKTIKLDSIGFHGDLYPKFVVITGRSICHPHPHRHYTIDEFIDKLNDKEFDFRDFLETYIKHHSL